MGENTAHLGKRKVETKNLNFDIFYKYKDKKSYLIFLISKYQLVNFQYICNIKKNKFKPKNIMKLSTCIKQTRKAAKSLKIDTNSLEITAKEEDSTTVDAQDIILLF